MLTTTPVSQKASIKRTPTYFRVLLFSTAALATIRFLGFLWFFGRTMIRSLFNKK